MLGTVEDMLDGVDEPEELDLEAVAVVLEVDDGVASQVHVPDEVLPALEQDRATVEPPQLHHVLAAIGGPKRNAELQLGLAILRPFVLVGLQVELLHQQRSDRLRASGGSPGPNFANSAVRSMIFHSWTLIRSFH